MARVFGSSGDKIEAEAATSAGGERTYTIWSYRTGQGGANNGRLWAKRDPSELQLYNFPIDDAYQFQGLFSSDTGQWTFDRPGANEWHHIAIVYDHSSDANSPTIYVDGVEVSVTVKQAPSGSSEEDTGTFYVGNIDTPDRHWDGMLAEFAVWDRGLTEAEIRQVFGGISPTSVQGADLLLYWPIVGDSPEVDESGNGNDGTVSGTTTTTIHPFQVSGDIELVAPTAIYTWWTVPLAQELDDTIHVGGVEQEGFTVIQTLDGSRFELDSGSRDDHRNPALLVPSDAAPIAFYTRHNADQLLRYRIGTTAGDVSTLGSEQTINVGGTVSYTQIWRVGDELWVATRIDDDSWYLWYSDDYGSTWDSGTNLLTESSRCYITSAQTDSTVRCAAAKGPAAGDNKVYYFEVNLATGSITKADGTVIGNLDGTGLPFDFTDLDTAYTGAENRTRLFAISDRPSGAEIAVANWPSTDADDATYVYVEWNGSSWVSDNVVAAGTRFGYTSDANYLGGMAFLPGTTGSSVYLARESSSVWTVEHWEDDGGWGMVETFATSTAQKLIRPWPLNTTDIVFALVEVYPDDALGFEQWEGGNLYAVQVTEPPDPPAGGGEVVRRSPRYGLTRLVSR